MVQGLRAGGPGVTQDELRAQILGLVEEYHAAAGPRPFVPGESVVPISGRVYDAEDMVHLVDSSLDFWLTAGRFAERFERDFARLLGLRSALLCNSGSSANLLALTALTSPVVGEDRLRPGDEVITLAAGFPTMVNPIIQNRCVPVFIDMDLATHNVDVSQLEAALSAKTRAVIFAHTLGNPFDLDAVTAFCAEHDLWLVEDDCDALGATYRGRPTSTFGDVGTFSFYPAHHITMGEGGAVVTDSTKIKRALESFRDWGRDCWCAPGKDNTCGKRFDWQLGTLPPGYDHKYIYSHVGYNLKATDMQAAVGVAQLDKLPGFIEARRRNFEHLRTGLADLEDILELPEPTPCSHPSWFGFPVLVRAGGRFSRRELIAHLESRRIATRLIFAGNLTRQPAYATSTYRVIGDLATTDRVMRDGLWLGVYPGLTPTMLDYVIDTIRSWCRS